MRTLDPLALAFQVVVIRHVGAGTEPELLPEQWVLPPTEPSLQPLSQAVLLNLVY